MGHPGAAILSANSDTTDNVVTIQLAAGTYALSLGQLEISTTTTAVHIIGTGSSAPTPASSMPGREPGLPGGPPRDGRVEDLEITGGQAAQGGGIDTSGNLELDDVLIDHDTAVGGDGGGVGGAGAAGQGGGMYVAAGSAWRGTDRTLSDDTVQGGGGSN